MTAAKHSGHQPAGMSVRFLDIAFDATTADIPAVRGNVFAIGNFDGVHVGHRALLRQAQILATEMGARAMVLTFEPHPRQFFQKDRPLFRLTPPAAKARIVEQLGLAGMVTLGFDGALSALSASAFVDAVLVRQLGAKGIVIGADFRFGAKREGNAAFLVAAGREHGFVTRVVKQIETAGVVASSSAIRSALAAGDVAQATAMLGEPWRLRATVQHGDKRGRTLGYPTANLHLDPATELRHGIYAVEALIEGASHAAVASFGRRPTFDGGAPKLEVHVFDFAGDLYGQEIGVVFHAFLRPEERFDSLDALIVQMDQDSVGARAVLASVGRAV